MGRDEFTYYSFSTATASRGISFETREDGTRRATCSVTHEAEQRSKRSGTLEPAVDPAVMVMGVSLATTSSVPKFSVTV